MRPSDGSSFTEVLVSLFIVSGSALALMEQQCHLNQLAHQLFHRQEALFQQDNALEEQLTERHV